MTRREKKKLQADFLKAAGPNAITFKAMMDCLPNVGFYMKDAKGRIMSSLPKLTDSNLTDALRPPAIERRTD